MGSTPIFLEIHTKKSLLTRQENASDGRSELFASQKDGYRANGIHQLLHESLLGSYRPEFARTRLESPPFAG